MAKRRKRSRKTWKDIPKFKLITLLGEDARNLMMSDGYLPSALIEIAELPAELLPVTEALDTDPDVVALWGKDGERVKTKQIVWVWRLVEEIAIGLGLKAPVNAAPPGDGYEFHYAVAQAIVCHLRGSVRINGVEHRMIDVPPQQG